MSACSHATALPSILLLLTFHHDPLFFFDCHLRWRSPNFLECGLRRCSPRSLECHLRLCSPLSSQNDWGHCAYEHPSTYPSSRFPRFLDCRLRFPRFLDWPWGLSSQRSLDWPWGLSSQMIRYLSVSRWPQNNACRISHSGPLLVAHTSGSLNIFASCLSSPWLRGYTRVIGVLERLSGKATWATVQCYRSHSYCLF